ncbi:hypothetical protein DPMN_144180 [Dreissena polymorpha]|uniref:Fibronectin type-III domain-containing protein n=1 Tax=Dreissena polymorpha TaxID=45954 RepID=A0A9D4GEI5_DREPO|nr:hypothetical protein DPMN_144180 [Dreissena polymorpha]
MEESSPSNQYIHALSPVSPETDSCIVLVKLGYCDGIGESKCSQTSYESIDVDPFPLRSKVKMAMCKLFLQIKCLSEDGQHNCSRSVNGSTHSLRLENLVAGMNYNIEMAAVTSQGTGKWSSVFAIG